MTATGRFIVAPRVDNAVVIAFLSALLDCLTTCTFLALECGVETNPTLARLVEHSLLWVPAFILIRPLLIIFAPDDVRWTFAVWAFLLHVPLGVNNLCGIIWQRYFLYDLGVTPWLSPGAGICSLLVFLWLHKVHICKPGWRHLTIGLSSLVVWAVVLLIVDRGFGYVGIALQLVENFQKESTNLHPVPESVRCCLFVLGWCRFN